jgi:hypothetical protein
MTRLAALLALAASVAALGGCGSSDVEGTIPASDAAQLNADLDAVEAASASQDCEAAAARVQEFVTHVNALPATAGTTLKETLRDAAGNLEQQVRQPCASGATGTSGAQPTTPERQPRHRTEDTTTTEPTTTETTTTSPEPEPPPPPEGNNGNHNGAGNGNANGQGNGNSGVGGPGEGTPGGTGGTGIGGD